jgi:Zn-dependent protease
MNLLTFVIVLVGWIFSLCLHEFAHAFVAYRGGDYTVRDKGYLTFNPLKYTNPMMSILLPLLFLALGGIGLPGGAVYIETWRLRSRNWQSAVSLAGPSMNILLALVLALVLQIPVIALGAAGPALAFLAFLQVTAALINLVPLPPLDGYGILAPHLNPGLQQTMAQVGQFSMFVLLAIFWFGGAYITNLAATITSALGIEIALIGTGYTTFMSVIHLGH